MPLYRLKKGSLSLFLDGERKDLGQGQTVELTEERAKPYLKRLELVGPGTQPQPFNTPTDPNTIPTSKATEENPTGSYDTFVTGDRADEFNGTTEVARDYRADNFSETQDMKAPEVIELVQQNDSVDELRQLQTVEEQGQNRIGVMKAIQKRILQLE